MTAVADKLSVGVVLDVNNIEEVSEAIRNLLKERTFTSVGIGTHPLGKIDPWIITGCTLADTGFIQVSKFANGVGLRIYDGRTLWTIPPSTLEDESDMSGYITTVLLHEEQIHITMEDRESSDKVSKIVFVPER